MFNLGNGQNVLPHPALVKAGYMPQQPRPAAPQRLRLAPGKTLEPHELGKNKLFRVIDGCIATFQLLSDGRRQITDILGAGKSFRGASTHVGPIAARALTFTEIEVEDVSSSPEIAAEAALASLERLNRHATILGRMTAAEKVANALADLAEQFPRRARASYSSKPSFTLYLTRADLADWLGLTVETVSRTLNQFKRDGVIDYAHAEVVTITKPNILNTIASRTVSKTR